MFCLLWELRSYKNWMLLKLSWYSINFFFQLFLHWDFFIVRIFDSNLINNYSEIFKNIHLEGEYILFRSSTISSNNELNAIRFNWSFNIDFQFRLLKTTFCTTAHPRVQGCCKRKRRNKFLSSFVRSGKCSQLKAISWTFLSPLRV